MEHKGKTPEKDSRKPAERNDRGKKLVRTEDFDVPRLNNYSNYTPLKESRAKIFNVHKEDTRCVTPLNFQPLKRNQNREGREEIRMLYKKKKGK